MVIAVTMTLTMYKSCDDDEDNDGCRYNILSSVSSHNNMVNIETWESKGFVCELLFQTGNYLCHHEKHNF